MVVFSEAQADYARADRAEKKKLEHDSDDGMNNGSGDLDIQVTTVGGAQHGADYPTEHERATLRRVPGGINIKLV